LNRSSFAFFVALLIHIVIFLLFFSLISYIPSVKSHPKTQEKKIKISLKELPKKYKKSGTTKKKIKPKKIAPPMPKGSQLKKIVKKPPVKYKPKQPKRKQKLNKPKKPSHKTVQKVVKKTAPIPPKKPYIPLLEPKPRKEKKQEKKKDPLAWMYEDKSNEEKKQSDKEKLQGSNLSQNIKELYGEEFGKLTKGQQKYILDNQEIMRRITQEVLTRVARVNIPRDLRVNSTNVIEFKLHPNGDMTDFRFLKKSGYYILDDTTKETIEYAYSRYPRPKETTLIRYNVFYQLAY